MVWPVTACKYLRQPKLFEVYVTCPVKLCLAQTIVRQCPKNYNWLWSIEFCSLEFSLFRWVIALLKFAREREQVETNNVFTMLVCRPVWGNINHWAITSYLSKQSKLNCNNSTMSCLSKKRFINFSSLSKAIFVQCLKTMAQWLYYTSLGALSSTKFSLHSSTSIFVDCSIRSLNHSIWFWM